MRNISSSSVCITASVSAEPKLLHVTETSKRKTVMILQHMHHKNDPCVVMDRCLLYGQRERVTCPKKTAWNMLRKSKKTVQEARTIELFEMLVETSLFLPVFLYRDTLGNTIDLKLDHKSLLFL